MKYLALSLLCIFMGQALGSAYLENLEDGIVDNTWIVFGFLEGVGGNGNDTKNLTTCSYSLDDDTTNSLMTALINVNITFKYPSSNYGFLGTMDNMMYKDIITKAISHNCWGAGSAVNQYFVDGEQSHYNTTKWTTLTNQSFDSDFGTMNNTLKDLITSFDKAYFSKSNDSYTKLGEEIGKIYSMTYGSQMHGSTSSGNYLKFYGVSLIIGLVSLFM